MTLLQKVAYCRRKTVLETGLISCLSWIFPHPVMRNNLSNIFFRLGQTLTVTGKHYNETDTGYESCNFKRTYTVPETINTKNLASHISEDGILTLEAPKETKQEEGQVSEKKENYQLSLDVSGYKPEEISVRVDGKDLIIRGETKEEHEGDIGKSIRHHHFTWLYNLPNDIDAAALSSRCTKDGKLTIEAPRMEPPQPRSLQIMKEGRLILKDGHIWNAC